MKRFTSNREKRLWLWALALVLVIYSTLGPVQLLAQWLREHNLLRLAFGFALFLILVPLIWQWAKKGLDWREVLIGIGLMAVYLFACLRIQSIEERTHLIEYSLVVILIHTALTERKNQGRPVPYSALIAMGATITLGCIDEGIQFLLPNRVFDPIDVGFNTLASVMGITVRLVLLWAQRRFKKPA